MDFGAVVVFVVEGTVVVVELSANAAVAVQLNERQIIVDIINFFALGFMLAPLVWVVACMYQTIGIKFVGFM